MAAQLVQSLAGGSAVGTWFHQLLEMVVPGYGCCYCCLPNRFRAVLHCLRHRKLNCQWQEPPATSHDGEGAAGWQCLPVLLFAGHGRQRRFWMPPYLPNVCKRRHFPRWPCHHPWLPWTKCISANREVGLESRQPELWFLGDVLAGWHRRLWCWSPGLHRNP